MKVLHLTLKKKWFDMVGPDKPEEYRDDKQWIRSRLMTSNGTHKHYDVVEFSNGYGKHVPKKIFEYRGFKFGEGKEVWGAEPGKKYFVIKLGERIN